MTGCLYAVASALYVPIDPELISDFVIASKIYFQGLHQRFVPRDRYSEIAHEEPAKEFEMRVRIVIRSIHGWSARPAC